MTIKHAAYVLCISFVMLATGCAAGISQQSRSKVTYKGLFSTLQKTPDAFMGEVVILGGRIIETEISASLSEIIALQLDLSTSGRPVNSDQSQGRFIVQTRQILDPALYQKDMLLTVVGTIKGSKVQSIGGFEYTYPLVELIEIKLWPKEIQTRPSVHIGIGVGTSF